MVLPLWELVQVVLVDASLAGMFLSCTWFPERKKTMQTGSENESMACLDVMNLRLMGSFPHCHLDLKLSG